MQQSALEMRNQTLIDRGNAHIATTYGRTPIALIRGEGMRVWDADGKMYYDFLAGLGVNNLGHCHPRVVEAIRQQAGTLLHVSNLYHIQPQIELADMLAQMSFADRSFFCNSGTESCEAAIKLARKYSHDHFGEGRYEIITFENSFHGRTMGSLSATAQHKYHKGFEPLLDGFQYAPFNDLQALERMITPKTCAVMIEPIQGEGGVNVPSPGYLKSLRQLCEARQLLLIYDEVQCGIGRTGKLFAYEHEGVPPDIMTLAKSLAGGVPIGALLAREEVASAVCPGHARRDVRRQSLGHGCRSRGAEGHPRRWHAGKLPACRGLLHGPPQRSPTALLLYPRSARTGADAGHPISISLVVSLSMTASSAAFWSIVRWIRSSVFYPRSSSKRQKWTSWWRRSTNCSRKCRGTVDEA